MTPTQPSCPYRDFAVSDQLGYSPSEIRADKIILPPGGELSPDHLCEPELCNLPNGSLLVSTWSGYCFEVDPVSGLVAVQPKIGLELGRMSSPTASTTQPTLCSGATHV